MTSQSELADFLSRLRTYRGRLSDAVGAEPGGGPDPVADEVAELGEELLVAEEELRTMNDELAATRVELERVWERDERLFGGSATAYVITDSRGMVVDANGAAWQLLGLDDAPRTRRPVAGMFPPAHRRQIRSLISLAAVSGEPQAAEVTLSRGGQDVDIRVGVELRAEPQSGAALLRWQLAPTMSDTPLLRLVAAELPTDDTTSAGTGDVEGGELGQLLLLARANLAAELSADEGVDFLLERVVELTLRWIPGAEQASVCRLAAGETLHTAAVTGDGAAGWDELQAEAQQGPTFDVIADHQIVRVDDLADEPRWPAFTARALDAGLRSVLACELPVTRGGAATLNLYSRQPAAFGPLAELVAPVFSARASIAIAHADQVYNLRQAIESRQVIGQALGVLMERHKLSPDQAFDALVSTSQTSHVKLRELATRVAETGQEPGDVAR